jgi:muramoyltetrapeptide carboxypeptidase
MIPPYLQKGDTILIIATARARNKDLIQPAIDTIQSWGFTVETGKNLFRQHHQYAGTDEQRTHDLQWAIDHKTAKAVLVAGGGYGTLRIIDKVNFKPLLKYPKWFCGYSDATFIQARLATMKIPCIHSTMAFQFLQDPIATLSLKQLLLGNPPAYTIPYHALNRPGSATAVITGGNLSLIYALSGSNDDLDTKHKILFIEDLDEQLYHVDRMLMQLKRSGKLKNLKALIVGGMSDMKDNTIPFGKDAEEIIHEAVKEYRYPVCFNFPAGHIPRNMALYLGMKASLTITKNKVTLKYN